MTIVAIVKALELLQVVDDSNKLVLTYDVDEEIIYEPKRYRRMTVKAVDDSGTILKVFTSDCDYLPAKEARESKRQFSMQLDELYKQIEEWYNDRYISNT